MRKKLSLLTGSALLIVSAFGLTGCVQGSEIEEQLNKPIDASMNFRVQTDVKNAVNAIQVWLVQNPNASDVSQAPVKDTEITSISAWGSWDDYTVTGESLVDGYTYTFESKTGTYK